MIRATRLIRRPPAEWVIDPSAKAPAAGCWHDRVMEFSEFFRRREVARSRRRLSRGRDSELDRLRIELDSSRRSQREDTRLRIELGRLLNVTEPQLPPVGAKNGWVVTRVPKNDEILKALRHMLSDASPPEPS